MQLKFFLLCVGATFLFSGCGASKAPDFPRSWRPLNELPDQSVAIPLSSQHIYRVVQLDTTVKGLLERWAEEAKIPLIYSHSHDFTLFKKVRAIRQSNLEAALEELSAMYGDQDMVFYVENNVLMAHKRPGIAVVKTKK